MSLYEIYEMIKTANLNGGIMTAIIVIILSCIQASELKLNPWTWLFTTIGNIANKPLLDEVKELKKEIKEIKKNQDDLKEENWFQKAMSSRYRIIRAYDEVTKLHMELSDDHLEQLGEDVEIYDDYCRHHPEYLNHKGQNSRDFIVSYEKQRVVDSLLNN